MTNSRTLLVVVVLVGFVFARNARADEGSYALEFLTVGVGARALGMGGAHVALADDATAAYWNPAGLADVPGFGFAAQRADLFQQGTVSPVYSRGLAQYNFANAVFPFQENGKLAISWARMGIDDIPRVTFTDNNGDGILGTYRDQNFNGKKDPGEYYIDTPVVAEYFSQADDALFISYARRAGNALALGGSLKLIRQSLYNQSGTGFGLDIGAVYSIGKYVRTGLMVEDVTGTRVRWNTASRPTYVLNANPKVGVAASVPYKTLLRATVAADADLGRAARLSEESGESRLHVGGELTLLRLVSLRAGLDAGEFTTGAGFRIPAKSAEIQVDYAFTTHPDLGDAQRLSVTGAF